MKEEPLMEMPGNRVSSDTPGYFRAHSKNPKLINPVPINPV